MNFERTCVSSTLEHMPLEPLAVIVDVWVLHSRFWHEPPSEACSQQIACKVYPEDVGQPNLVWAAQVVE